MNALEKGKENNKKPHLNITTFSHTSLGLKDGGFMKILEERLVRHQSQETWWLQG